jgi:hypothetical protein
VDAETKNTRVFVDPPSGWKYGFPKQAPTNLRKMDSHDLTNWLVENGYPIEEVEYWTNSPKFGSVPCRFFEMEIQDMEDEKKSLYERFHAMFNDMLDRDELSDDDYMVMRDVEQLLKKKD